MVLNPNMYPYKCRLFYVIMWWATGASTRRISTLRLPCSINSYRVLHGSTSRRFWQYEIPLVCCSMLLPSTDSSQTRSIFTIRVAVAFRKYARDRRVRIPTQLPVCFWIFLAPSAECHHDWIVRSRRFGSLYHGTKDIYSYWFIGTPEVKFVHSSLKYSTTAFHYSASLILYQSEVNVKLSMGKTRWRMGGWS